MSIAGAFDVHRRQITFDWRIPAIVATLTGASCHRGVEDLGGGAPAEDLAGTLGEALLNGFVDRFYLAMLAPAVPGPVPRADGAHR